MRAPVCACCESELEFHWPEAYEDTFDVRCPGTNPKCSPREDRVLLVEEQVEWVEVERIERRLDKAA